MTETDERPPPPGSIRAIAAGFYLLITAAGVGWCRLRTGEWLPATLGGGHIGPSLLLGAALAAIVLALTGWLRRRIPAFEWFVREIRRLLGPIGLGDAAILALCSGIGEEIFFRGVMQPALGYVATSLVFGLLHTGPDRRYLAWTGFAIAMGFALGGIVEATGSLAGAIAAHVGVNFVNLARIGADAGPADRPARGPC